MEKLKFIRLVNFLDKYNILNENQFSFRSGRSTTQASLPVTDKIQRAIENELYSCGIFVLFDTVDHNIFFAKLDQYGLFPLILNQQTANKFRFRSTTNDIWGTKRLCAWPSITPDLY